MLWPEQGLTFTFCRKRVCHLKRAIGNSLKWADHCMSRGLLQQVFSNLLKGIKKVRNWFKWR